MNIDKNDFVYFFFIIFLFVQNKQTKMLIIFFLIKNKCVENQIDQNLISINQNLELTQNK